MTLSENLAKIAQKIDFNKINGDDVKHEQTENGDKSEEDSKDSTCFQPSLLPWDSITSRFKYL